MSKHFAIGYSEGPCIANLQLQFWRLAVEQYERIAEKWSLYAVEGEEDESEEYTDDDFVVDAAVAIVLAGTSLAELVGQNVSPNPRTGKTPHIADAIQQLTQSPAIPANMQEFIGVYDSLRHFGPAKHATVEDITEEKLCDYLATVQDFWTSMLHKSGRPVTKDFRHTFRFDG